MPPIPQPKDYKDWKAELTCRCQAVLEINVKDIKYKFTPAEPEECPPDFDRHDYYIVCPLCKYKNILSLSTTMHDYFLNKKKVKNMGTKSWSF